MNIISLPTLRKILALIKLAKSSNIIVHTVVHQLYSIDSKKHVHLKFGRNCNPSFNANSGRYTFTNTRKRNQICLSSIEVN